MKRQFVRGTHSASYETRIGFISGKKSYHYARFLGSFREGMPSSSESCQAGGPNVKGSTLGALYSGSNLPYGFELFQHSA